MENAGSVVHLFNARGGWLGCVQKGRVFNDRQEWLGWTVPADDIDGLDISGFAGESVASVIRDGRVVRIEGREAPCPGHYPGSPERHRDAQDYPGTRSGTDLSPGFEEVAFLECSQLCPH